MKQIERYIGTLTTILRELREGQRSFGRRNLGENQDISKSSNRPNRGEKNLVMRNQLYAQQNPGVKSQYRGKQNQGAGNQFHGSQNLESTVRQVNIEERELRQHLHDIEQEFEQVSARNLSHAVELEAKVRRLAQIIDQMQGQRKPPSWRIILDNESPLSIEIIGTTIPRDFCFPNLRYSKKINPLVHI